MIQDCCNIELANEITEQAIQNKANSSCWLMNWEMFEPMFYANMTTAISYFAISSILIIVLYIFWGLFSWLMRLFVFQFTLFIGMCGVGHVVKVYNFWWGDFQLELFIDIITAFFSFVTALSGLIAFIYSINKYRKNKKVFKKANKDFYSIIGAMQVIYKKEKTNKRNGKTSNIQ